MRLFLFFLVLPIWVGITGCDRESESPLPQNIRDRYATDQHFAEEDRLRYEQDYERAALSYESRLETGNLSQIDSLYAINQIAYCRLLVNKTKGLERRLAQAGRLLVRTSDPPESLSADFYFNKGRYCFLQNQLDSALQHAHRALPLYYRFYSKDHLKTAQTLTLLSLIHLRDGNLTDSIHYYALQADDIFLNNPALGAYDWENDYVQGYASLLSRAHERGEYLCRAALQKLKGRSFDNPWLEARLWNLLANMIKKRSDSLKGETPNELKAQKKKGYELSDSLFQKAILIGKETQDAALTEFYIDWIINASRFPDTTRFFQALNDFKQAFVSTNQWQPHYNRLLGYFYYGLNASKTIKGHGEFLKAKEGDSSIDYRIFADSYWTLRETYEDLNDFDKSAIYAKKSFLLYGCCTADLDINRTDAIERLDSTRRYCLTTAGFFAEGLLKKYWREKDPKDLLLADAYFAFIERHGFKTMLSKDEDAFLSFQLEAGRRIFTKAFEAAYETWSLAKEARWLDSAFQYAEYLKSYLLYRDMLKNPNVSAKGYSISDSIRLLQGQVNQAFFLLNSEGRIRPDSLYRKNIVNALNSLEHRRKEKLDSFELNTYRNLITIKEIQQNLPPARGLVNYLPGDRAVYGIYVDADTVIFFKREDHSFELRKAVQDYQESIEKGQRLDQGVYQSYFESGRFLYETLIAPFADRLDRVEQLIVVPDNQLDQIPFEAFLTKDFNYADPDFRKLPYLLRKTSIVYAASWKVFAANQKKVESRFTDKAIGFWTTPELKQNNGLESIEKSIRSNFGKNYEIYSREKNGKVHFINNHRRFDVLHLLLHANSSNTDRQDNQIRFGSAPGDTLYGFELYKQKFQAKLLVLASCESAAGAVQAGEGTFSLTRSFINAGVPQIVAAQYLIPQTTTGPLLSHFYQYLGAGEEAGIALHRAKIKYLETIAKDRHAYPRFWAGLVVFN